jgi:ATP-dependent DNA helicase RecQ
VAAGSDPMPRALALLRTTFGYPAFRGAQAEIVAHVAAGGDALVLMPTGGGKSLCYQIPSLLRTGTGVVVSPLIALMQDQVAALRQLGVRAAFLNSTLDAGQARATERALLAGELDILYFAPERLATPRCLDLMGRATLRCSPSMKRTVSRNGAMISGRSICSCPCCTSAFRRFRASR